MRAVLTFGVVTLFFALVSIIGASVLWLAGTALKSTIPADLALVVAGLLATGVAIAFSIYAVRFMAQWPRRRGRGLV